MTVSAHHPRYDERVPDWTQMRDCYEGERAVKAKGTLYLPATAGMLADGMATADQDGARAYAAYRTRAVFPDAVKEAVEAAVGVMHQKPATIELPAQLEPLRERATLQNDSLLGLLRRINEEQILMGRLGLLADVVDGSTAPLPYIALYFAEHGINWDVAQAADGSQLDTLKFVVLDESRDERTTDGFSWHFVQRYRVVAIGNPSDNIPPAETDVCQVGVFEASEGTLKAFSPTDMKPLSLRGRSFQGGVPFVFVNAKDVVPDPDAPPLLGLSNLALTVYRGEADYRQALFMQGQDTLVVIGGDEDTEYRTGAGSALVPPVGGDAKYIGVSSEGLGEMRSALENDRARADQKGGTLVNEAGSDAESGEALRTRVAARTATLKQIALSGAFGLQEILRAIARWVGADPTKVVVTPNLDFVGADAPATELVGLMTAKGLGAPLSLDTIHQFMQRKGFTEKTLEEELQSIEDEKDLELVPAASTNPDGPGADPAGGEGGDDDGGEDDGGATD